MLQFKNLVDNVLQPALAGQTLDVFEPATGEVYAQTPRSQVADVNLALQAAQKAQAHWRRLSPEARSAHLYALADAIDRHVPALAAAESKDTGKPLSLALSLDIPRAAQNLRFFAGALQHESQQVHARAGYLNYTLQPPVGIGVCISPWNLPLYLLTWKIAPALAAGNCIVAKPSEVTPYTAHCLGELVVEAGLPPGVFNILHGLGDEVGIPLCGDSRVKAISFTGSTRTGAQIAQQSAAAFKKVSLEMGGKNAALVFADAYDQTASEDYRQQMMDTLIKAAFLNQGQICLCTSRLLIERSIFDDFCADFVKQAQALTVGDPLLKATDQGAVVSLEHHTKIMTSIERAREEGGVLHCGGHGVSVPGRCQAGYFIAPTVITGLGPDTVTNQEEIFGPVVTLQAFDTESEAVTLANATRYGLAASLWSRDNGRVQRLSHQLEAGIIWVNTWMARDLRTPFGGLKDSGLGREGGWHALNFWCEPRNICIAET
jgi:aminomuconate-semialdehyde/2-hydroxymuconate-6-semialdehyde dehydrogenase